MNIRRVAGLVLVCLGLVADARAQLLEGDGYATPRTYNPRPADYFWDDGSAETNLRRTGGGDLCWIHAHTAIPGRDRIFAVQAAWGLIPNGSPARVFVWEDPNDDGNPNDAVLVAQESATVANAGTGIYNWVSLSNPPQVSGVFFIGAAAVAGPSGQYPIPIDLSNPPPLGRAWYTTSPTVVNAVTLTANEGIGDASASAFPAYMLLRANGGSGDGFTYQGELRDGGVPVTTPYDLRFSLWTAPSFGSIVGVSWNATVTPNADGRFTVHLGFPDSSFQGSRWLEVEAAPAGSGTYSTLSPRQELTPAPFATYSSNSAWAGLQGMPPGFTDGVDNDSGGDITAVTAGPGLTGGATAGAAVLNVNFAGTGVANSVARSDHTHDWTTITGVPAGFADGVDNDAGGDITGVTAGTGLSGGSITGNATLNVLFSGTGSATSSARSDHFHSTLNASDGSPAGVVSLNTAGLVTVTDPGGASASVPALTVISDGVTLGTFPNLTQQAGFKVMNTAGAGILIANNTIHSVDSAGQTRSLRINQTGGSVLINGTTSDAGMPDFGLFVAKGGIASVIGTTSPTLPDGTLFVEGGAGIGISAPSAKLHVADGVSGVVSPNVNSAAILERAGTNYLSILSPDANERGIIFAGPVNANDGGIYYNVGGSRGLQFRTNANTTRMSIDSSGRALIGSGTATEKLDVRGNIALGASGELLAPGGEENLRVLRGRITSLGAVAAGAGLTASRSAVGVYTVTFTTAFASEPSATVAAFSTALSHAVVTSTGPSSIGVRTFNSAGALADVSFFVVVAGQR